MGMICGVLLAVLTAIPTASGEGLRPELENSVEKGLEYLLSLQDPDGAWPGNYGREPGVVGLCALAFMAHGEEPGVGEYGKALEKALDFIVDNQTESGLYAAGGSPMYNHGFATLAIAEAYGMHGNDNLGISLRKAVNLIVNSQNVLGGWRYSVGAEDADITVTGSQMMALRAAQNAGMEVPRETISRGLEYIKACICPDGGFAYQAGRGGSGVARTGIAVTVLSLCGEYRSSEVKSGLEFLKAGVMERDTYIYYGTYYCSQAMFQAGGNYWKEWNESVSRYLIETQEKDGSWAGSGTGGVLTSTAMALLTLEVNWQLLPIYQR